MVVSLVSVLGALQRSSLLAVAQTDSIFAVITEELGLLGAFAMIALYLVILWRGYHFPSCQDDLGKWLLAGSTLWIFIERSSI